MARRAARDFVDSESSFNDWEKDSNGEAYRHSYADRGGEEETFRRLDSWTGRALERSLRGEESLSGTGNRIDEGVGAEPGAEPGNDGLIGQQGATLTLLQRGSIPANEAEAESSGFFKAMRTVGKSLGEQASQDITALEKRLRQTWWMAKDNEKAAHILDGVPHAHVDGPVQEL